MLRSLSINRSIAFIIIGLMFLGSGVAMATVVNIPRYKQERDQWCWAAASKMIINYRRGLSPSQCNIVKKGLAKSTCPNEPGSFVTDINRALMAYGAPRGTAWPTPLPADKLRSELDLKRPVMIRIAYPSSGTGIGHIMVLRGYTWNPGGKYYTYSWNDPGSGSTGSGKYDYLVSNSKWRWSHTRVGL